MRRCASMVPAGFVGLILLMFCGVSVAWAVGPSAPPASAPTRIVARDEAAARRVPVPPRGIRSLGPSAVRADGARVQKHEYGAVESAGSETATAGVGALTKISGTPGESGVTAFRVSPDGTTAVFIAGKHIYSVPVDSLTPMPTKLSDGLSFGSTREGVSAFEISLDSASVVFLADANAGNGSDDIYSVPINTMDWVRLNPMGSRPITAFGITPNSAVVVFLGDNSSSSTRGVEVYSSPIGAGSATQLSHLAPRDVVAADFSPDSTRIVYAGDAGNGVFQWYSVLVGGGTTEQLSNAMGSVSLGVISPDSNTLVYAGDDNSAGTTEVFSVPITGGSSIQLNQAMDGSGATAIEISPDSNWVAYVADQDTDGVHEVYAAQTLVGGSGTRLNPAMAGGQFADIITVSPDSSTVVYEADQNIEGTSELFGIPINASGTEPMTPLQAAVFPDDVGFFFGVGTPIIAGRVVYPVVGSAVDLFSVPFDGSPGVVQINTAPEDGVLNVFLPALATRLMAYGTGDEFNGTQEVHAAAIRGNLPPEQINITAVPPDPPLPPVQGYEITSDELYGVYLQAPEATPGTPELWSRQLDSDWDAVININDNCPFVANPAQDPLNGCAPSSCGLFLVPGDWVEPVSSTTFAWTTTADVRFVRGPLDMVDVLATDDSGTLLDAVSYSDSAVPSPVGAGWYYLFAVDCAGRSYQTAIGAEPNRDLVLLP